MKLKKLTGLVAIIMGIILSSGIEAQTFNPQMNNQTQQDIEVSDAELQTFLDIAREMQMLQYQMQNNMVQLIKDSPMTLQRFKEISSKQQQGQKAEMTDEEQTAMNDLQKQLMQEQQAVKTKMDSILGVYSMKQNRYMAISRTLQTDEDLQNRLKELQQEGQKK